MRADGFRIWFIGLTAASLMFPVVVWGQAANGGETFKPRPSIRLDLDLTYATLEGRFLPGDNVQEISFDKSVRGRYFCLETLSAQDGRPYAAVAELDLLGESGALLERAGWRIAYVDSEEHERENGAAENALDGNAATFWHTQWGSASPSHPHHLVIDLGQSQTVTGFRYLPRPGTSREGGRIKDFRIYVSDNLLTESEQRSLLPQKCFLFSYFVGEGADGLHLAYSLNGYRWDVMNRGRSVLKPQVGARLMRDPHLSRAPDGTYHLVWTAAWRGDYIGHATSKDLVHWSEQRRLDVMRAQPGTVNCWAPELYWQTNERQWLVYWASRVTNGFSADQNHPAPPDYDRIYCATTKDFETFSAMRLMYDPGFGGVDATLVPYQGRFCMVFVDTSLNRLRAAMADRLDGPFGPAGPPFTSEYSMGPTVFRLGEHFIAFYENKTSSGGAVISPNLEEWKSFSSGLFFPAGSHQGSVLELGQEELKPLLAAGWLEMGATPRASELGIGNWIWATNLADRQTCRLWRSFSIPQDSPATRARLRITADNSYTVYIDGQEIGRGGDPNNLTEYDLGWWMTAGRHVLAVEAFNDLFDAGVILGLRVDLADGRKVELYSDSSWRVADGAGKDWKTQTQANPGWPPALTVGIAGGMWWQYPRQVTRVSPLLPPTRHFWQQSWFLVVLLLICAMVAALSIRQGLQLTVQARSRRLLERERARIASDIHDDLGAGLTQLTLIGELLLQENALAGEARSRVESLCSKARTALQTMDEIIWAVNPRRDTVQDFVAFISEYAQEYLAATPIRCRLDVPDNLPSIPLDLPARRNLLLAIKEAVRNTARHSGASELLVQIHVVDHGLRVVLRDNGKGFEPVAMRSARNGLDSMRERLADVGGACSIQTAPGRGCQVTFTLPLNEQGFSRKWLATTVTKAFGPRPGGPSS